MAYSLRIGFRYLRSKKRSTVSVITLVAIAGVALGVGALLAVLSITSGFQDEFRNKVLGVNAHVLVLKYGLDFGEYRDVVWQARRMPEVAGAAPFIINEMMLAKGDRIGGVLVKGVDPNEVANVLDLPEQIVEGGLEGLRAPGAAPPVAPEDLADPSADGDLDAYLQQYRWQGSAPDAGDAGAALPGATDEAVLDRLARLDAGPLLRALPDGGVALAELAPPPPAAEPHRDPSARPARAIADEPVTVEVFPEVDVPSPEDVARTLAELEAAELPTDAEEARLFGGAAEGVDGFLEPGRAGPRLPGIVVGKTLAANLGIRLGDTVKVISPLAGLDVSLWAPTARTPRSRDFRVIGVFEAGFQEYDTRLVYVDLYEAQGFFEHGDVVTGVELRMHDLERAPDVSSRLERALSPGPFHTLDWRELNHNLFTALEIQKIMLSLVIATIIFVAAFNVVATLIMVVLEKKREIAILKAMGATDSTVLGVFFVQGATIGAIGTVVGLVLGGGVCAYLSRYRFELDPKVYLIDHLPVRTSVVEFLLTVAIALLICVVASLAPSYWASKLLPADGVRYE